MVYTCTMFAMFLPARMGTMDKRVDLTVYGVLQNDAQECLAYCFFEHMNPIFDSAASLLHDALQSRNSPIFPYS